MCAMPRAGIPARPTALLGCLLLVVAWTAHAFGQSPGQNEPQDNSRIRVFPLFFLTRDATLSEIDVKAASARLKEQLSFAQAHFQHMLGTDTFAIEANPRPTFRSRHDNAYLNERTKPLGQFDHETVSDSAHRMLLELFAHYGETRESTRRVYLLVYVRAAHEACGAGTPPRPCLGGGRSLEALPEPGGGVLQLEYTSLMADTPYAFRSTLIHELGHAFGLAHVDCHGYDMQRSDSIMSYNQAHIYPMDESGERPGEFRGTLNPEEYFLLALNRGVFPNFRFDPTQHDPDGRVTPEAIACSLGPMRMSIGRPERHGYRLYYDGKLVSGAEAAIWTFAAADANCRWNLANRPGIAVTCTYSGLDMEDWRRHFDALLDRKAPKP